MKRKKEEIENEYLEELEYNKIKNKNRFWY